MPESWQHTVAESFGDVTIAIKVLNCWRDHGPKAADQLLAQIPECQRHGFLIQELALRLNQAPAPRLLVDGVWLSRATGGVTRVWDLILRTWQLPGLFGSNAPLLIIDRQSCLSRMATFPVYESSGIDPLDPQALAGIAPENSRIVSDWGANVFLSSWISTSDEHAPSCAEVALVHDCMPERSCIHPALKLLRRRWLKGASAHLAVSAATAMDLEGLLSLQSRSVPWCHQAPDPLFATTVSEPGASGVWSCLRERARLQDPFVLLPSTSALGTYKNPELVARSLADPALGEIQLVLCGMAADQRCRELEEAFPHLSGRTLAAGFSDPELALVYRHALAVVIPSRIEGFGLPAVEAMAVDGTVLVADSRGLREAGAEAALRFSPEHPKQLADLLRMLLDASAHGALHAALMRRRRRRLQRLHPDLFGLCLLAQARVAHDSWLPS